MAAGVSQVSASRLVRQLEAEGFLDKYADQLELAGGKSLAASVRFRMPKFNRGAFQLQLVYNGMTDAGENQDLVLGGYHGDPINFEIE